MNVFRRFNPFSSRQRLIVTDENIHDTVRRYLRGYIKQPIGSWDVSRVTNMEYLFAGNDDFNKDISQWDVSNVTNMSYMFMGARNFNKPLNNWNVRNVTNMSYMFSDAASFNQPLDSWDVSNVTNMIDMFNGARNFNQPLNNWIIGHETNTRDMFLSATSMEEANKPRGIAHQVAPQGEAFQVHNYFNKINKLELLALIGNSEYNGNNTNFISTIKEFITQIISKIQDQTEKNNLQAQYQQLLPKINVMDFYDNSKRDLTNSAIEFVKRQSKQYQENYVRFLLNDSCQAYNSGVDTTSCVKGIQERLIFSLASAGSELNNVLYENIAKAIYPDPINNESINHFISKCIEEEKEDLKNLPGNMGKKKQKVLECVKTKIKQSNPDIRIERIESLSERIEPMIPEDMLEDDALNGGKRKTTKKRRTTRKRKATRRRNTKSKRRYSKK